MPHLPLADLTPLLSASPVGRIMWRSLTLGATLTLCSLFLGSCDDDAEGECPVNPQDPSQYVIVGFWSTTDCSGDPIAVNSFPVQPEASCYCWPGNSGENSARDFTCNPDEMSFTYTQYNSLTCGEGDPTPTEKTVYTDQCKQDIPPTIYAKIIDYGACAQQ